MNEKNLILYFTGTKNSLMAARMISSKLAEHTQEGCSCISFSEFDAGEEIVADRLGIVCPVYFWGLPNLVRTILERTKIKPGTYIFSVITMGSNAGNALSELNSLLKKTQNQLSYGLTVKCPDCYSTVLGSQKPHTHERILEEARGAIEQAADDIMEKKVNQTPKYHKLLESLVGSYRRSLSKQDKKFFADGNCNGCGYCAENCPVKNIRMEEQKPVWQHQCEFCLSCISFCPKSAVQMGRKTKGKPRYQNPFQ